MSYLISINLELSYKLGLHFSCLYKHIHVLNCPWHQMKKLAMVDPKIIVFAISLLVPFVTALASQDPPSDPFSW